MSVTKVYLECSCNSTEHIVRFVLDNNVHPEDPPSLYMDVQLIQYRSFFKRAWIAIKYIFGYQCRYGHWDCVLFERETASNLRTVLDKYIEICDTKT